MPCIIVGSSRGLGAALVDELLRNTSLRITGIARSPAKSIDQYPAWAATGRYGHHQMDIVENDAIPRLQKDVAADLPQKPLILIFNAAVVISDVRPDGHIDFQIARETDQTTVDGLRNTLRAFEGHLLKWGGVLVGISSFAAFHPPIMEPKVAYPASKAYLDMTLRCLRSLWRGKVRVVTVHLGHFSPEGKKLLFWQAIPSCSMTARKIAAGITSPRPPDEINYPFHYTLAYKYVLRVLPDRIYSAIISLMPRIISSGER